MRTAQVIENLERRGYQTHFFDDRRQAQTFLLGQIAPTDSVGIGGSMTISELGLYEALCERGQTPHWHWKVPPEQRALAHERAMRADVYLSSVNAITQDGKLYNIDGTGNRVAAILYGPRRVYLCCGLNKLVEGGERQAIERIKTKACPRNARRLGLSTPCARLEHCVSEGECASPQRMCNMLAVLEHANAGREIHIVLVGEELGF